MLSTVHIQIVVDLWRTQARPQHTSVSTGPFGGHAVNRVIHAVACNCLPLHGYMGPGCSVLLQSTQIEFPGIAAFLSTHLVTPFPPLALAVPFR